MRRGDYWSLFLGVCFLMHLGFVSAVEFNGTIFDENGNVLNNTLVNVTVRSFVDFSVVDYYSTYSNASGWFNLTIPTNSSWMYQPLLRYTNGTVVTYVGQSLPAFPYEILADVSGTSFFLLEAGTINITALNASGAPVSFSYQIKDQKLGYEIAGNMDSVAGGSVSEAVVYVPRGRNYSIMLFPNESMPATFDWNNFSSSGSYSFDGGNSNYNETTKTLHKQFNMTMGHGRVWGYANIPAVVGLDEFKVAAYLIEPGDIVHSRFGTVPHNLSSFFDGTSDWYNLDSGVENNSGFFNISLPSTVEYSEMLLFAVARNGTSYWAGLHNLSLDYGTYTVGQNLNLNFSTMSGLLGDPANLSLQDPTGGPNVNVSTKLQAFNLINASNVTLTDVFAHIEARVDYSDYGVKEFTWMEDIEQGSTSTFYLPLLNVTGIEELNVFASGGNYAPTSESWSVSEIIANNNVTLRSFNPQDLSGTVGAGSSSITIALYHSNSTCDVPSPTAGCIVGSSEGMDTFDPMKAIMGGGKLSFRMGVGGVLVHYVNVDMLASGPPDALFEDDSSVSETTSGSFGKAMRFGSGGPKIYDFVMASIPYTEGSSSTTGLNESAQINLTLPALYDEDWNVIWNTTNNGTSGSDLGGNFSHYRDRSSEWEILMGTVVCTDNVSIFNATNPCYVDTSNDRIWVRLPHFSGTQPSISGSVVTSDSSSSSSSGSSGGGGGSKSIFFSPSTEKLEAGYDISLQKGYRVRMALGGESHTMQLIDIASTAATVSISSDPIRFEIAENDSRKVDVDSDGYYDLDVYLKDINFPRARFILTSIQEQVSGSGDSSGSEGSEKVEDSDSGTDTDSAGASGAGEKSNSWFFVVLILVAVGSALTYFLLHKKTKH